MFLEIKSEGFHNIPPQCYRHGPWRRPSALDIGGENENPPLAQGVLTVAGAAGGTRTHTP